MITPWGKADSRYNLLPGVWWVGTPSHGGLMIAKNTANELLPAAIVQAGDPFNGFLAYEEDCACTMAFWAAPDIYRAFKRDACSKATDASDADIKAEMAESFRHWYPDVYELVTGTILKPGESRMRDQKLFYQSHTRDFIVCAAWGDWQTGVPKGMVGVVARLGGRESADRNAPEKWFLVPAAEYQNREAVYPHGFVIDLSRHQEVACFTNQAKQLA